MEEKDINRIVEETLSSIDNIKKLKTGSIDYRDILSKTNGRRLKNIQNILTTLIFKAAAVFILHLSLNLATWLHIAAINKRYANEYYNNSIKTVADNYFK